MADASGKGKKGEEDKDAKSGEDTGKDESKKEAPDEESGEGKPEKEGLGIARIEKLRKVSLVIAIVMIAIGTIFLYSEDLFWQFNHSSWVQKQPRMQ